MNERLGRDKIVPDERKALGSSRGTVSLVRLRTQSNFGSIVDAFVLRDVLDAVWLLRAIVGGSSLTVHGGVVVLLVRYAFAFAASGNRLAGVLRPSSASESSSETSDSLCPTRHWWYSLFQTRTVPRPVGRRTLRPLRRGLGLDELKAKAVSPEKPRTPSKRPSG